MAWKTMDIQEQRVRFVVAAAQGTQGLSSLCAEFGISRPTGYLWLRRYQELGIRGIAERSRRVARPRFYILFQFICSYYQREYTI